MSDADLADPPTTDSGPAKAGWIGRDRPRVEDARLLTGKGRFVDDCRPDGCLHVAFVRSPFAHGRLRGVETAEASAMPGVVAVYTGADVAGLGDLPVNPLIDALTPPGFPVLARDVVQAVGQPVAAVIAESLASAQDAAELVFADIDPRDPVLDGQGAAAPELSEVVPGNRAAAQVWQSGDVDAAFATAAHIVEAAIPYARLAPCSLEPRAILAEWTGDGLTVWLSTQTPHRARKDLADIAGLEKSTLRVVAPDVGGAFGMKASLYPEDVLVAWAAARLQRPVKWVATRGEDLLAATQARGLAIEGALALSADGALLGLRARLTADLGHWLPFSAVVPLRNAARILPGPYRVPAVDIAGEAYLSTMAPVGIYRGAGRPEAAMLMERLMDKAAAALQMDPAALRARNLIPAAAMPFATPTGETLDSGDYPALLQTLETTAGYEALRADQARRRAAGELVGLGLCLYIEPCGLGWESARVTLQPDGTIAAATGSTAQGQGRETAAAQIVADALRVDPGVVTILHGDTATTPVGVGALASRSTPIGGGALHTAATRLRNEARGHAAALLQADPRDVTPTPDGFAHGNGTIAWPALAAQIASQGAPPLSAELRFEPDGEAWGAGAVLARVAVDPDTGVVTVEQLTWIDDAGTVLNPTLLEGQLLGGIAQGLGEALIERVVYDGSGQLLTGSFMDYGLPRASDMPPIALAKRSTPSPLNPLGAKGVGEAGTIGAPPAVLNAVLDALSPLGVTDLTLPLTSETVWRAIREGIS